MGGDSTAHFCSPYTAYTNYTYELVQLFVV